jgi:hypothetical protein
MKPLRQTIIVTSLSILFGSAFAAVAVPDFKKMDANRDGFISSDESGAAPAVLENFSLLDRNADGKLSKEEYAVLDSAGESGSSARPKPESSTGGGTAPQGSGISPY